MVPSTPKRRVLIVSTLVSIVLACGPVHIALVGQSPAMGGGGWGGYFKTNKGETKPIQAPLERNKDQDWMFLQFHDYVGPKSRIAVMPVDNKTASAEVAGRTNTDNAVLVTRRLAEVPVASIEELLVTAFVNSHRYRLVERKAVGAAVAEQDLATSGRVAQQGAAATGRLIGAQFLVFAAVNEWSPEKSSTGGGGAGVGGGFLGAVGIRKGTAEVAMSFRLVDATTGEVLSAMTERATAGNWGIGFGGVGGGGGGAGGGLVGIERNTPMSYAVQACINKAVYKLVMAIKDRPWSGAVMKLGAGRVYVNAGSDAGLTAGLRLAAMAKGEALIDPDTGATLGSELSPVGTLELVDVQEKYAVAKVVEGCKGLKVGDVVMVIQ